MLSKQEAPAGALASSPKPASNADRKSGGNKLREQRDLLETTATSTAKKSKHVSGNNKKPVKQENRENREKQEHIIEKEKEKEKVDGTLTVNSGGIKRKRPVGSHTASLGDPITVTTKEERISPPPPPKAKMKTHLDFEENETLNVKPVKSPNNKKTKSKPSLIVIEEKRNNSNNEASKEDKDAIMKDSSPRSHRAFERTRARSPRLANNVDVKSVDGLKAESKARESPIAEKKESHLAEKVMRLDNKSESEKQNKSASNIPPPPPPTTKQQNDTKESEREKKGNSDSDKKEDDAEKDKNAAVDAPLDDKLRVKEPKKSEEDEMNKKQEPEYTLEKSKSSDSVTSEKNRIKSAPPSSGKKRKRRTEDILLKENAEKKEALNILNRPPKRNASKNCPGTMENDLSPEAKTEDEERKVDLDKEKKQRKSSKKSSKVVEQWVQCERCQKWRVVPPSHGAESLPDHWYCEMNIWDPISARCSAPEEEEKEDGVNGKVRDIADGDRPRTPDNVSGEVGGKSAKKRAGPKNKPARNRGRGQQGGSNSNSNNNRPRINSQMAVHMHADVRNKGTGQQENKWVMCETCQQWRKLPSFVDTTTLPDKWYCHMNKWDPLRQSCSAPEETDDSKLVETTVVGSANAFVRLPEGASLYGNNVWPVLRGNKAPPVNYRELIVGHYRHFKQWEITTSKMINERYRDSSLYIPQDISKMKSSKHSRKSSYKLPSKNGNGYSVLGGKAKSSGISRVIVEEKSLFYKLLLEKPSRFSKTKENGKSKGLNQSELKDQDEYPYSNCVGLLKFTKPWKVK